MKKIICLLVALLALPSIALAGIFTTSEIVPRRVASTNTHNWSGVATWALLRDVSPGAACSTCYSAPFYSNTGMSLANFVLVRICSQAQAGGKLRLVSFYTDNAGVTTWDRSWGEVTPGVNPSNQAVIITEKWNALWSDPFLRGQQQSFMLEVIGTGQLYEAQFEIDWK